jgi:hypothetical protein
MSFFNDRRNSPSEIEKKERKKERKETFNTDTTNDTVLWVECGN